MGDIINVAVTIDRNYLQPAGVMLNSMLTNTDAEVLVYLLHPDLTEEDCEKLNLVIAKYDHAQIEYIRVTTDTFSDFVVPAHFSSVMYYKLCFGILLPDSIKRLLYLDPDTLVLSNIKELWDFELGDALYSAVPLELADDIDHIIKKEDPYYSCGVMLINIEQWRQDGWDEKLLKIAHDLAGHYEGAPEMQILAAGTSGRVINMPIFWNWWPDMKGFHGSFTKNDLRRIKRLEGIVHFPYTIKPWHYACAHPQRNLYVKYRKGTPWENAPLENRNLISFTIRSLPYPVVFFLMKNGRKMKLLGDLRKKFICR